MAAFTVEQLGAILGGRVLQQGRAKKFNGVSIDSRLVKKGNLFVAIRGVNVDGHDFISEAVHRGAVGIVVSKKRMPRPPASLMVMRVSDTTQALGQLAHAHRMRFQIPVIAVTGSAGKTTTKEMIAGALSPRYRVLRNKGSFNNFWGVPLTLLRLSSRHDVAVVELGTSRLGEISYLSKIVRPTVAVLTNIGPAHLEGLQSVENVYREKRSIFQGLEPDGTIVLNADDRFLSSMRRMKRKIWCYGVKKKADVTAREIILDARGRTCFLVNGCHAVCLKTPVWDNVLNALAAVCCARLLGLSFREILTGLEKVRFRQGRQQVERINSLTVINDSYNANPVSFRSALFTLDRFPAKGRRILVCGDMLELGAETKVLHRELGRLIAQLHVDMVFAFGSSMAVCAKEIKKYDRKKAISIYDKITALNRRLVKTILPGDVILVKGSHGMRLDRVVSFLKKRRRGACSIS